MKSYRITVNGNVYDVTVEETTGNEAATATHPVSNAGSVEIKSSVPGKIIAVEVSQGQAVKAGDTVVILESMKMEIQSLHLRMEQLQVSLYHREMMLKMELS